MCVLLLLCGVTMAVAAANNNVGCLAILKEHSAIYLPNDSGNLPIRKYISLFILSIVGLCHLHQVESATAPGLIFRQSYFHYCRLGSSEQSTRSSPFLVREL